MTADDAPPNRTGSSSGVPVYATPIEARIAEAGLPPLPRQAWLEVDLDALGANARQLRSLLPHGTLLGLVVKADGYGHGLEAAARAAVRGGADLLLVATLDEAFVLRALRRAERILVLYPVPPTVIGAAVEAGVEIVAADEASVDALVTWLRAGGDRRGATPIGGNRPSAFPSSPVTDRSPSVSGCPVPGVHLAIDSGMGRGGLRGEAVSVAARRLLDAGLPGLAGTWSHLASPEDAVATAAQVERFEAALAELGAAGIDPGLRHLDATGGLLGRGGPTYDLVRIGLAFYGLVQPELEVPRIPPDLGRVADALRPALTLRARAATITAIPMGGRVGYAGTWTAARESVVATIPVGYADGWTRAYSAGAWAVVRGFRVPLVGRVSSDALALDVTDVPGFGLDDEVVLIGEGDVGDAPTAGPMTVHDLAALRGSIAWEVLDDLAPRLSRVYIENGAVVGVRYLDGVTRWTGG